MDMSSGGVALRSVTPRWKGRSRSRSCWCFRSSAGQSSSQVPTTREAKKRNGAFSASIQSKISAGDL